MSLRKSAFASILSASLFGMAVLAPAASATTLTVPVSATVAPTLSFNNLQPLAFGNFAIQNPAAGSSFLVRYNGNAENKTNVTTLGGQQAGSVTVNGAVGALYTVSLTNPQITSTANAFLSNLEYFSAELNGANAGGKLGAGGTDLLSFGGKLALNPNYVDASAISGSFDVTVNYQ